MAHPYEKITDDPEKGFQFLKTNNAKEISETKSDTERRATYETPEGIVLIETESRLEAPYYYYHLYKFVGEE